MRILLVSFVGDNRWSGMGKWTHSIAAECEKRGHGVSLWFADDFPRLSGLGRVAAILFPPLLAVRLLRDRRKFDVVVVHEPSGVWYGLLRRVFRHLPPMIAMSHGVESRRFELLLDAENRGYAFVPRASRWKTPLIRLWQADGTLRFATQVICLSSYDREYLISKLGLDPSRVTLMINGVDAMHFVARPDRPPAQRVLFVAGWFDSKGSLTLPELWLSVKQRHPHASLTLVGTGASADAVRQAFPSEVHDSLSVIPRLTDPAEMIEQFASHDIFLMPSLNEGSPLALLEGMAAGLPVVAARAGGIPDIVTHEENGLLFNPLEPQSGAEQLSRLLEDPDLCARLADAAMKRAAELTWSAATDALIRAVGSALGGTGLESAPSGSGGNAATNRESTPKSREELRSRSQRSV